MVKWLTKAHQFKNTMSLFVYPLYEKGPDKLLNIFGTVTVLFSSLN